jgi:hypothetical protein
MNDSEPTVLAPADTSSMKPFVEPVRLADCEPS